eukprot:gene2204-2407_t
MTWEEDFFYDILNDELFEIGIDIVWLLRSRQVDLAGLFNLKPLPSSTFSSNGEAVMALGSSPSTSSKVISCNVCGKDIAGSRYAPHLERCLQGGKRAVRRPSDLFPEEQRKIKKEVVDPFPNSPVVRIKLRAGVPMGNKVRLGASLEEFYASKTKEEVKPPS